MRVPTIQGIIRRRLLVNFRVAPGLVQRHLPGRLRPKLHDGFAVIGVCLIRLERIRPRHVPGLLGLDSENAAHRIAVMWEEEGKTREGVYISRRDTDSRFHHLAGGRLFPGEHHRARFDVADADGRIDLRMRSDDGAVRVDLRARAAPSLPGTSIFGTLQRASDFFEPGSVGYSITRDPGRLDGVRLKTRTWRMEALEVEEAHSSYFAERFPGGTMEFDSALRMSDIEHEWRAEPDFLV